MRRIFRHRILWLLCSSLVIAGSVTGEDGYQRGIVASVNRQASEAGLAVLKSGGNAVDAAVAVGFALGVVDGHNSGIGGGCFMLIRRPGGQVVAIDGRETAPAKATRDMYVREGRADTRLSQSGALACGVPGEVAAFDYAIGHFGRKSMAEVLAPAIRLAEEGFVLNAMQADRIASAKEDLEKFESSKAVFFRKGRPLAAGERLKQKDLAATYRHLAKEGVDWFYRGGFARAAGDWMGANGGILSSADFSTYNVVIREPVETTYRGWRVVSFPPPGSGGVHLLQMLNILESFPVAAMDSAARTHVFAEAMKLAFADRAHWLGDPDFARVPRGLLSKSYAAGLMSRISMDHAGKVPGHGMPPGWESDVFKKHTTHFCVADDEGNWVACTATINTTYGSKVVVPGTGVVLNNEMDDFAIQPGVRNAFGLVGADANCVEPGKRPLSSMSPTIVLKDGEPVLALGAAGGPKIITTVLTELVQVLDLGMTPAQAVAAPRVHHQWSPDELIVEEETPVELRTALEARGHVLKTQKAISTSQIIQRPVRGKGFIGAGDPRVGGVVAGW
ncbi:MAG: gamma-glutamyltransferase [Verrucomicrobia bacterium]|nr:gamma-glutamyltransferase [Verrucomicrobiota bacterium]